jgi:hypothetical protein
MRSFIVSIVAVATLFLNPGLNLTVFAQGRLQEELSAPPEDNRPPLFFRESWKSPSTQEPPLTQEAMENDNLELKLYGGPEIDVRIVIHTTPKDDPSYVWSGSSPVNWAVAIADPGNYVDLSSPVAKVRWRTKPAAFNLLRPILKLADGTYLVGDYTEGYTGDWRVTEFSFASVRWRSFDPINCVTTRTIAGWIEDPDLSQVEEVGFTDLTRGSGGGAGGGSRVDWIEVYGFPIPRS